MFDAFSKQGYQKDLAKAQRSKDEFAARFYQSMINECSDEFEFTDPFEDLLEEDPTDDDFSDLEKLLEF